MLSLAIYAATMSIQKRRVGCVARWQAGRQLQLTFSNHGNAEAFETDNDRRHQLGVSRGPTRPG